MSGPAAPFDEAGLSVVAGSGVGRGDLERGDRLLLTAGVGGAASAATVGVVAGDGANTGVAARGPSRSNQSTTCWPLGSGVAAAGETTCWTVGSGVATAGETTKGEAPDKRPATGEPTGGTKSAAGKIPSSPEITATPEVSRPAGGVLRFPQQIPNNTTNTPAQRQDDATVLL